ncbi:MAG: TonB-dependent receptor [Acidobacteriota bacterium]|nr:TonB-dependent receptor [Blastocatellia bacterium]MDW8411519.1 TonB-dependent receptor [Acidobacteriota bacterium]
MKIREGSLLLLPTLAGLLFILSTAVSTLAQTGTSTVRGTVIDPNGAALAGVTVTLINTQTSASRTQTTGEDGSYIFKAVLPGNYRITAEAAGFKKGEVSNVRALVDTAIDVNISLEIGETSEIVQVTATSTEVLINTQDASLGNNFVAQQITQLPLESRNVAGLLSLQPGVTPDGYVTGSRSDQANITLDGVDVNDQIGGFAFQPVLRVTADSVTEFRVTTTNPNASQGRSAGAQVSLITKSGTNEFHGSLYHFHRNTVTTANDYFSNRAGLPRPALLRNVFGGSIGGPIKKDKLFFFYNYEGFREAKQGTIVQIVPLASLARGELKFINGSRGITTLSPSQTAQIFSRAGINPATLALMAEAARRYPANDLAAAGDGLNTGGFRFNAPLPVSQNTHTARFDWNVDTQGKHIVFARLNYQVDYTNLAPAFPDTPSPKIWTHPYGGALGHTWTISNTLVNSFRYGLTRDAFTIPGDSNQNRFNIRDVYQPFRYSRTFTRVTPVQNFVNDVTWIKGTHTVQFGGNIRLINTRTSRSAFSFDDAIINRSWYEGSGAVLLRPITSAGFTIDSGFRFPLQSAVSALIGRINQYNVNYIYGRDGNLLPAGSLVKREFATQEYDMYIQDIWKIRPNLTFTYGLRYGLSRPVYERNGLQAATTVPLGEYFERRKAAAAQGQALEELISVDLAGPANGKPGSYEFDKNNFQPRVSLAWTPNFSKDSFLGKLFGSEGKSVLRGGFAIVNDFYGIQIANQFDVNNALGFTSTFTNPPNSFNITTKLAPLFVALGQNVRNFPGVPKNEKISFPRMQPADLQQRIETSIDQTVRSPYNYSFNVTYGRELPKGIYAEVSYIGRVGRNLLATRDVMALNNIVDVRSGMDWYQAAGVLADYRDARISVKNAAPVAWFENVLPRDFNRRFASLFRDNTFLRLTNTQAIYYVFARESEGGYNFINGGDWTFLQLLMDLVLDKPIFFNPQYGALATWSSIATSDYHGMTVSVRQRLGDDISWDFNYTFSKSLDLASGLQREAQYTSDAFILNPLRPKDNRSFSEFDLRHIINANGIWYLPVGRGKRFLSNANSVVNALLGGWQLTTIFRWNSGLPVYGPFDGTGWATNWNIRSTGTPIRKIQSSPTRGGAKPANLFKDPVFASQSFRNARAGETGVRNFLRDPGYVVLDMGINKFFQMPWNENHKLQFRWEVFNVTNTQRLTGAAGLAMGEDNTTAQPGPNFGNFTAIQGTPRVMQFALRFTF